MSLKIKPRECSKANNRKNHSDLPKTLRAMIVGKSGCGKTTLLLNLLTRPGFLDYDNLLVFGKSLFQPEYKILRSAIDARIPKEYIDSLFDYIPSIEKDKESVDSVIGVVRSTLRDEEESDIEAKFYDSDAEIPDPSELDPRRKNLIIFDDVLLEKQKKCESYYTRGRHSSTDCIYLSQNYFSLPRQTIRENSNFICLFRQANKSISDIYHDHASLDMPYEEFKMLCNAAWREPYGFLTIDLTRQHNNGKYRLNLDKYYTPTWQKY